MSDEAVVDAALEAAHQAVHALHATGCIRDRGAHDCPLLPDLRVAVTAALRSTEKPVEPSTPVPLMTTVVATSPRRCRRCGTPWPVEARSPLIGTRCGICGAPLVHPNDFLDALQLDAYIQLSATLGWRGDDAVPHGVLKEDILRSMVPFIAQSCGQHYTTQGRIQGLEEAANEVHIEARWQQEQVQTARKGGKSIRGEFVERLLMVETILTDRVKSLTEPNLIDFPVGWDDPDHERRHRKAGVDWPCCYGQAECPVR